MRTPTFLKPDAAGLKRLIEQESIREDYNGTLALIHDLLCEYGEDHGHARFRDQDDVLRRIQEFLTTSNLAVSSLDVDRCLLENLENNTKRAIEFRDEALQPQSLEAGSALREEITEFLDLLVETYRDVIQPRAAGPKPRRSVRR